MKRILYLLLALMFSVSAWSQWTRTNRFTIVDGSEYATETPASGLGLETIFVFKNLATSSIEYKTASDHTVKISTYKNSLSDMVDHTSYTANNDKTIYTISNLEDSRALVVNDNGNSYCVWIIDYSLHKPKISGIAAVESDDKCTSLKLVIEKEDLLEYRGNAGQVRQVSRKYDITYQILEWDKENYSFVKKEHVIKNLNIGTELILGGEKIPVPNINTEFTISGDQFGRAFKIPEEKTSAEYQAVSVEAHIRAVQAPKTATNEGQGEGELGGSAPIDIEFFGYANEPVAYYYTWFVYNTKDKENHIARYTDKNFDYTFDRAGDYEVVLEVANGESSCVTTDRVTFNISESELDIPNFFSPGGSGAHNEFKVYYKSLVKYHCVIFNRWGNKVWESRDPAQAWDGRYKGSLVNPGVYFYSIEATGSEGKKYKEGGDINVLR